MRYHLLTGATGLLGSYLLRDGLCAGRRLAVVVRSSALEDARQRVESILARWEGKLGYALPRPPVLEGDLTQPNLGLGQGDLDWIARHCVSVIHNAASLSFHADSRSGEPYRSNVEGTRNVLQLCRATGIRQFHHVSTAYVCGLRKGQVLEDELDVGQELGNDYEKTKVQAESMVREAEFLDPPTIYRPAIIIGDSATGYTTTFHGFYTPLKIAQALVDRFRFETIEGAPLIAALGFTGQEGKHFVPVDWVSRVITFLHNRPEHHGRTYHLTLNRPVSVAVSCEVIVRALEEYVVASKGKDRAAPDLPELQQTFTEQMETYRAYWRDDPQFDSRNTAAAAPHLPPPEVDFDMLMRTARFALETNFGWPRPQPIRPEFDISAHIGNGGAGSHSGNGQSRGMRVGLQINGPGGGQWTLFGAGGHGVHTMRGLDQRAEAMLYLNAQTFAECVRGRLSLADALRSGRLVSECNHIPQERILGMLQSVVARENAPAPVHS